MKLEKLVLPVAFVAAVGLAGCKSEVDNKTAAEVSEPVASSTVDEAAPAGEPVAVLKDQSSIGFVGAKVTRDHHGGFHDFDGTVTFVDGKPAAIEFAIDLNSIYTDTDRLTNHLKTADFFDVEQFPTATFKSTEIAEAPAGNIDHATHMISGTLDMHGITKEVTFPATVTMTSEGISATAEFTINRQDWKIAYAGKPDDLVKDEVLIKLDLKFPLAPAGSEE